MAVKTYHTMDKDEWYSLVHLFHPQHGSHWIDLPNGRILVAVTFANEWSEEEFAVRATSRKSLPHPVFEGTDKISSQHVDEIGHLFASKQDAAGATVRDVVKHAAAVHPLMRLSVF